VTGFVRGVSEVQKLWAWEGLGMVSGLTLVVWPMILMFLHAHPTRTGSGELSTSMAG
jgi:hypothetical protein